MKHLPCSRLLLMIVTSLVFLPGCNRYVCWLTDVFNQGCKQPVPLRCIEKYIKSTRIYDQFETLGIFDALWLNRPVREMYLDAFASTRCLDPDAWELKIRQQEYEDEHYIMFYLLTWIPSGSLLTDLCPEWHVQLRIGCECFNPIEIRVVELCPEYQRFFGPWFTIFKKVYLLKFNAIDVHGNRLINRFTSSIDLVMSRLGTEGYMTWCLDGAGDVLCPRSFNRNIIAYDIQTNI